MSFQINLAPLLSGVVTDATKVQTVADKALTHINVAQQIGAAWGLTGAQKLDAVKQMLLADLAQVDPPLATEVTNAWPKVAGVLSAAVSIFNLIGWAFEAAAPIVAAAVPGAGTAIAAINAAVQAASAVEKAVGVQTAAQPQQQA